MAFKPPVTPPYTLIIFYLAHVTVALVEFVLGLMDGGVGPGRTSLTLLRVVWPTLLAWVAGTLPLEIIPPAKNVASGTDVGSDSVVVDRGSILKHITWQTPSNELTMPEDSVNLWSWSTFSFVEPLFDVAGKRTLHDTDVWNLSPYFTHKNLFNKYLKYREECEFGILPFSGQ